MEDGKTIRRLDDERANGLTRVAALPQLYELKRGETVEEPALPDVRSIAVFSASSFLRDRQSKRDPLCRAKRIGYEIFPSAFAVLDAITRIAYELSHKVASCLGK
jgi:hypothetical protein